MTDIIEHDTTTETEGWALPAEPAVNPRPAELAEQLVEQAQADGVELVGPDGLLGDLTKRVLEAGLEAEMERISATPSTTRRAVTAATRGMGPVRRR